MAKSKIQQLQEALEKGDNEAAKRLAGEIAKKAPRRPAKRSTKKVAPPAQPAPVEPASEPPAASRIILPGQPSGIWVDPNRSRGGNKVYARHESMQGRVHKNEFEQWVKAQGRGADGMDGRMKKADKQIANSTYWTPRPGMAGAARPPAQKTQVYCDGCGRPFLVYPSELTILDSESVYKCDRCIRRGK